MNLELRESDFAIGLSYLTNGRGIISKLILFTFLFNYATTLQIEKRISEGRRLIGELNSVLWSKTILHKIKKIYVPGFSPKYSTIWGRNMDTKHTAREQITGN
jgi:hypothetical protein